MSSESEKVEIIISSIFKKMRIQLSQKIKNLKRTSFRNKQELKKYYYDEYCLTIDYNFNNLKIQSLNFFNMAKDECFSQLKDIKKDLNKDTEYSEIVKNYLLKYEEEVKKEIDQIFINFYKYERVFIKKIIFDKKK